jgi:hypothetical protein
MTVGGRTLDLEQAEVIGKLRTVEPEPIREHLVEIGRRVFPPKQVLAVVTGWDRQTFTTMEAQRVLTRVGVICRRAGHRPDGGPAWVHQREAADLAERAAADSPSTLEARLVAAELAITALNSRVTALEARD